MVLPSLSTRWNALADRCSLLVAMRSRPAAVSSTLQYSHTSTGPISALVISPVPLKRLACTRRAASIRSRVRAEVSVPDGMVSFSYSTLGTSTKRSILSIRGPLIRLA